MTAVCWTQPSIDDFLRHVTWIAAERPASAALIGRRILNTVERLSDFPLQGRTGRSPGTCWAG